MASYPTVNHSFRRLALVTAALVYLLIVVGAVVRVTESGLGCPDWPLCYGGMLPPPEQTAVIEFTQRLIAGIAGLFILLKAVVAWRYYRRFAWVARPALFAAAMVPVQYLLGASVVATELAPAAVAIHLGTALLIFAGTLVVAVAAHHGSLSASLRLPRRYLLLLAAAVAALFALLLTGAMVAGSEEAAWACADWPLCNGRLLPGPDSPFPVAIQTLHRAMAMGVGLMILFVAGIGFRLRAALGPAARLALLVGALFVVQAAVGAIVISMQLEALWRATHLAFASAVWAALVALTASAFLQQHRYQQRRRQREQGAGTR